ncbi:hypothetical protein CspHIS471_0600020 [Cutaneotrichosporon sp. HIS471]|nr:hypothetical protein CspHIS471_0600020 [Cutaneotrichosporon sp. HIS471]
MDRHGKNRVPDNLMEAAVHEKHTTPRSSLKLEPKTNPKRGMQANAGRDRNSDAAPHPFTKKQRLEAMY